MNGQPHVGHAQLGLHAAIHELHATVHDALWVDEHFNLRGLHAKQPFGLNHLEAFIHQRCRVDSDFIAHAPSGMFQGVGSGDVLQLPGGEVAKGPARAREQDLLDARIGIAHKALEDGAVLAVDGKDGHVVLPGEVADELAGDNQGFFIGQAYLFPGLDGVDGGQQARKSYHCGQHHIDGAGCDNLLQCGGSGIHLDVGCVGQQRLQGLVACLVGDDHGGRLKLACLLRQQFHLSMSGETIDFVAVAMLTNNVERLRANATGAAKNTYLLFLHFQLYKSRSPWGISICMVRAAISA